MKQDTQRITITDELFGLRLENGKDAFLLNERGFLHASNGRKTQVWNVADALNVPIAYLNGVFDAAASVRKSLGLQRLKTISTPKPDSCNDCDSIAIAANNICRSNAMPTIPVPTTLSCELAHLPAFSGVYFGWRDDLCTYVGKSTNVPQRMISHEKIERSQMVSWIELPACEIGHAECFYIWLLQPLDNRSNA